MQRNQEDEGHVFFPAGCVFNDGRGVHAHPRESSTSPRSSDHCTALDTKSILDGMAGMAWAVDSNYCLIYANGEFLRQTRQRLGVVPGPGDSLLFDSFSDEARATWRGHYDRAFAGEAFSVEAPADSHDGAKWIEYRIMPIRNHDGHVQAVTVFAWDVTDRVKVHERDNAERICTERVRMAEALRASERQLRQQLDEIDQIYRCSPVGLVVYDRDLRFVRLNDRMAEIDGIPVADHIGRTIEEVVPGIAVHLRAIWRSILETGNPVIGADIHGETPKEPGAARDWIANYYPFRSDEGDVIGIIGAVMEVTERKRTEEALRLSQRRYRLLFQSMTSGFALHEIICDADGKPCDYRFLDVNPAFERLTGLKAEDVIGRTVLDVLPGTEPYWIELYGRVALTGESAQIENYSSELDRYYDVSAYSPEPRQFAVIVLDITERKRSEEARLLEETRLDTLVQLNQRTFASLQELADYTMEAAIHLTCSSVGYVAFANHDESVLTMYAWSREAMAECNVVNKPLEYPVAETGLWGEAVRQRRAIVTNDYQAPNRWKRGLPEGHVPLARHMNVPIFEDDRIVVVAGVGNKDSDYDETDVRQLTLLMSGMWRIVQRQRVEEALRDSETRYRLLADNMNDVLWLWDVAGARFTYVSPSVERLAGYTAEEICKLPIDKIVAPESLPLVWDDLPARIHAFNTGDPEAITQIDRIEQKKKDGSTVWTEIVTTLMNDSHDALVILGVSRDISERKRAEDALEKRLVALTQPLDAIEGLQFSDLFDVENIQRIQDSFAEATRVASVITHPDGTPITRPSNFCRLCNEIIRRTPKGLRNCMCSDAAIGRDSQQGPTVQPCLSGGLWDAGASISVGGKHIANWLIGQIKNEAVDEARLLAYADEIGVDREAFRAALAEVPEMSREQFERIAQTLFILANELSAKAYQNVQQARFITERQRAESERQRLEQQMQHAQKLESLGVLAGGIAHDFNNILMAILGHVDLALADLSPVSPVRESLSEVEKAARRAAELCRQMLAYSGKGRFVVQAIDLAELVQEMGHMLQVSISKKVVLRFNLNPGLPTIEADASQLRQIVMNLVINASEAIGDTSGVICVSIGAMQCDHAYLSETWLDPQLPEGAYIYLEVADTGCGMDKETLVRIFDPFYSTKFTGRGLGLAAVLGIVRGHKGAIKVYSEPRRGTTFKVLFPATDLPPDTGIEPGERREDWKGKGLVLLVDDEETIRAIGQRMLERVGFSVVVAADGREALSVYAEHKDSLICILLDLTMPHMDGDETFRELRRMGSTIPVVIASGYNEQEVIQRFAGKGLAGFIQKPYQMKTLAAKLQEVLEPQTK